MAAEATATATEVAEVGKKAVVKKAAVKKAADVAAPAVPAGFGLNMTGKKKTEGVMMSVPYGNVKPEKGFNPRTNIGDVSGLEDTIKSNGLIHPLTVRPYPTDADKPGHYRIVSGERRYRAIGGLAWDMLPVIVREDLRDDDDRAKALAGSENGDDARQPLSHEDKGALFKHFADTAGWTVKKIARETGAGERDVRRHIDFVNAPEDVQKAVGKGKLGFTTAIEAAKLDDDTRKAVLKEFAEDDDPEMASSTKIKAFAKALNAGADTSPKKAANKKKGKARAAGLKAWKGKKPIESQLAELCHLLIIAEEKETTQWYEIRGAIGCILWQKGDISYPVMVPIDPAQTENPKDAKKELARLSEIIESYAAKHTPEPEETGDEGSDAAANLPGVPEDVDDSDAGGD